MNNSVFPHYQELLLILDVKGDPDAFCRHPNPVCETEANASGSFPLERNLWAPDTCPRGVSVGVAGSFLMVEWKRNFLRIIPLLWRFET